MKRTLFFFFSLFLLALTGMHCAGQVPEVHARWIRLEMDSIRVEYALPNAEAVRPAVIVLGDRYGMQENLRATLKVLATLGYRAYALPLLSAPEQPFDQLPEVAIDTADVPRVTQVAVEIMNEKDCDGKVMLLAFDVGANIAIEVIARFPFYKGAVLFYPTGGAPVLRRLLDAQCPLLLNVAQFDPDCSLADVNSLRELCMEQGKKLHVYYYKEAKRFFFDPQHPDYHKGNTKTAWNQINKFFRFP
ncbi:MAG: dienelactone hydrolase family protein [Bacteroidetes bacterium]|nr:dienelactone hydrolase family protein [Bacteroidota bacterium]